MKVSELIDKIQNRCDLKKITLEHKEQGFKRTLDVNDDLVVRCANCTVLKSQLYEPCEMLNRNEYELYIRCSNQRVKNYCLYLSGNCFLVISERYD